MDQANRFLISRTDGDNGDKAVRIFDLLSTNLIYVMRFDTPLHQMQLSADCRALFTTHGKNEIVTWYFVLVFMVCRTNIAYLKGFIPRAYDIVKLDDLLALPEAFNKQEQLEKTINQMSN